MNLRFSSSYSAAVGAAISLMGSSAEAQIARATGVGGTMTMTCNGGDAILNGIDNVANFLGGCRTVILNGDSNRVLVEIRPGARITVQGSGNRVRYRIVDGAEPPNVTIEGPDNYVEPAD